MAETKIIEDENITEIKNLKKNKGHPQAYRIRLHHYRLEFYLEDDAIILSRILHRKEIYRFSP